MSFTLEVPGEANPLTESLLIHSLKSASSSDPIQIQTGTKQLETWERSSGYYVHLQSAYLDRRLPLELRYLAIIQLKNGIDKYWRKTATNAVQKDDKDIIRSRLTESALFEHDGRLVRQCALVYAKIARYEFPNDWSDAINALLSVLRSPTSGKREENALVVLLQLTKELSTARLARSRQNLQAATPECLAVVGQRYVAYVEQWQQAGDVGEAALLGSLICIKVLRRLLITGFEHPNRDGDVTALWRISCQNLSVCLQLSAQPSLASTYKALVGKNMLQLAKLHHEMAKDHPAAFALLPDSVPLVQAYWSHIKTYGQGFGTASAVLGTGSYEHHDVDDSDILSTEKFVLRAMLVVRACVKMVHNPSTVFKYRQPVDKEERQQATKLIKQEFLSPTFVQEVMEVVITSYFVIRESDLREWEEEAEEWEKREIGDGEDWEFSVRSCAEKLFLDLAINYKDVLVQPLLAVFWTVATPTNDDILLKDSIYTAIGLAAPVLHDQLDFDGFIQNVLVQEVQKTAPGYSILRRRASILLAQWITVKISTDARPLVFQIYQHLLTKAGQSLNDQVVRITAGRQLKNIADDWEFRAEQFLPYADTTLSLLMDLVAEVESTETKMALLNTISVIVERLEHHIIPFAERIVGLLPPLWEQSGEEHLMKQAILTILARLVAAMKAESLPFHPLVLPIIEGAIQPGSETQVYLLEDAMDLWSNILVQTPSIAASPELLTLSQYLSSIFELGSENLRKGIEIAESYVLLAPSHMLTNDVHRLTVTSLTALIGSLRPDANGLVCSLLETTIQAAGSLGGAAAVCQVMSDYCELGLMNKLLTGLRGSYVAHCTSGPLAKEPPVDGIVETDYFNILARLVLSSSETFCQGLIASAPKDSPGNADLDYTFTWLLEEWFSHFENIGDPARRKLMALALTKLLDTRSPLLLQRLQSLMTVWTDVITELHDEDAGPMSDSLVRRVDRAEPVAGVEGPEAPEDTRRRDMANRDPVHAVSLPEFVKSQLGAVVADNANFQQEWLVNVDQDIVGAFGKLGIM
ncbi:hypothetical protein B0A48_00428 [Cryoendolithus antarcticus]|uniref:Importin N-terminal domain-containing protein n=1 Tax=Cryoendolithus antarcticus TaxID=1507870 RepID=A0A1V8TUN7_9PEZI|nr:hypothetical protein B0A48_00428 [Cryoendolithus antarcticus]